LNASAVSGAQPESSEIKRQRASAAQRIIRILQKITKRRCSPARRFFA
jgi:hypothetical protein